MQNYSQPAPPLNQGLSGGYDSDAEGLPYQGNLGGGFGEKAVCNLMLFNQRMSMNYHKIIFNYYNQNQYLLSMSQH